MTLEEKKLQLIDLIEEDIIETEEIINLNYPKDLFTLLNKLVLSVKTPEKIDIYKLSAFELVTLSITIGNSQKSYSEIKENLLPIKKKLNNLNFNDTPVLGDLIESIQNNDLQMQEKYLRQLNLQEILKMNITTEKDLSLSFQPLYLFLNFKEGYNNISKIKDYKTRKRAHQTNYNNHLQGFFSFFEEYRDSISFNLEAYKTKNKLNLEIIKIFKNNEFSKLYPVKKEYLDYLSDNVLLGLFAFQSELLNTFYCEVDNKLRKIENEVDKTPLTGILYRLGIIPKSIDKKLYDELMLIDINILEKRLNFLLLIGLTPKEIFTTYNYYLKNLDSDIIDKISFYFNSNIISKSFIIDKISNISTIFSKINTNYEILHSIVDFSNTYYNESILLEDLTSLKNKLSVLSEYNLTKNNYIFLLCNYEYLYIYDLMLEQDIPLYLLMNICYTKDPLQTIKRIMLFKELNIPYETPTHGLTKEIRYEKYFVCHNNELNSFYPTNMLNIPLIQGVLIKDIKNDDFIQKLDHENRVDDTYIIGDTIVSRPKVLKNFQLLKDSNNINNESKMSAILSQSIYTPSNLLDIKTELNIEKSYLV